MSKRAPRAPDARRHRTDNHLEFFTEMKKVFSRKFKEVPGAHVRFSDLMDVFATSRTAKEKMFLDKEKRLLTRHSRRLFLEQWPNAKYRVVQDIVCYFNIAKKDS